MGTEDAATTATPEAEAEKNSSDQPTPAAPPAAPPAAAPAAAEVSKDPTTPEASDEPATAAKVASPAKQSPAKQSPAKKSPVKKPPATVEKKDKPAADEEKGPAKPATSSREDNLTYDLRHMAAYDIAPLAPSSSEADFLAYTRDSAQMLVNHIFSLARQRSEEGMVVELPKQDTFHLPRQRPVPKVKAKTRWEKFAEEKGIQKRKRSRLVWDEVSGDWKPRWGYLSVKKEKEEGRMGIYEIKKGENPNHDPFEKMQAEKKLTMMRQKMREVRNKVESVGGKLRASVPDLAKEGAKRGKDGLKEALKRAQVSTGSRGKFDRLANNEPTNLQQKRQKTHGPMDGDKERDRYLKFAGKVLSGQTVDQEKAAKVGRQQAEGTKVARKEKGKGTKGTPGKQRRSKQGGRKGAAGGAAGGGRQRGRKIKA